MHGQGIGNVLTMHGHCINNTWRADRQCVDNAWTEHGQSMDNIWAMYGQILNRTCKTCNSHQQHGEPQLCHRRGKNNNTGLIIFPMDIIIKERLNPCQQRGGEGGRDQSNSVHKALFPSCRVENIWPSSVIYSVTVWHPCPLPAVWVFWSSGYIIGYYMHMR